MALDPKLLPYVDVEPGLGRSIEDDEPGIGLGEPQYLRFTQGMSMTGPDWQLSSTDDHAGWAVKAQDGFMSFSIPNQKHAGSIGVSSSQSFANTEGSVSIGFRIRVSTLQGGPLQVTLPGAVLLLMNTDGTARYVVGPPNQPALASSDIRADGQWRDVLVSVTPASVAVWEGDLQKFVHPYAYGPVVSAVFTASVQEGPGTNVLFDVSDVVVVSGTNKRVRPRRSLLDTVSTSLTQAGATASAAGPQVTGLQQAAAPLAGILKSTNISWWDWFWGRSVDPAMQQGAETLVADPRTQAYLGAYENSRRGLTGGLGPSATLCFSVGMTISAVVSISTTVGLNIDIGRRECQLVVSAGGGLVSNVSVGFGVDFLVFPRGLAEALGWFFYVKASGGEFTTYSAGLAGGIPPEFPAAGRTANFGLTLGMGIGAGLRPMDYGAGVSYTWPLS